MSRTRKIIKEFGKVRVFLVVFTICLGLYLIFNLLWFGKILPGTKVGVFNFGGRNSAQAEALLAEVMDTYQGSNTTFLIKGEEVDVPISDLGIRFDKSATLDAINRNRFVSLGDFLRLPRAFFGEVQINAVYSVDYNQFQNALGNKFSAYETKATNAAIVEGINGLEITQEKEGIVIDKSRLVAQLKENLSRIDGAKIQVSLVPDSPRITSAQLVKVKDKLAKLAQQTFVFNYGFDSWNLKWQDIQNLIVVDLPNTSGGYVTALKFGTGYTIEDLQVADTEKSEAQILLNHDKANEFLIGIAKSIDQQKVDATLKFENGRIAQFSPAIDGQELDRNAVLEQIGRKIATDEIASNKIISFKLP
ncbi:peptidoglycan binding domain-containing protein, partial [Candidatus Curtissbacteria bacterium]|nr:peptidoglycan binding domain-containing protein [Candidatus Curtissbacteria bacterium]